MYKIDFVPYDVQFLEKSWFWLNDKEVKQLTLTGDFTREHQYDFFNSLPNRTDYKIWGMKLNNNEIGVLGLKKITENDAEYFGYIGEKEYWARGLSKQMFDYIFKVARDLGLKKIYLRVSVENQRAISAYRKQGFLIVSEERNINLMEVAIENN